MSQITIRSQKPGDEDQLRRVHENAFAPSRNEAGEIVGHALFSPVSIAHAPENFRAMGLAPVGVLPTFQRMGIGSALIRKGLEECRAAGYDAVVVLGHLDYYPRFGFAPASKFHLENEYDAGDAFMALELREDALNGVTGLVRYAPAFRGAGF